MLRERLAKIIFVRLSAQISGIPVREIHWETAYRGWIENPALFPIVEVCIDTADEIIRTEFLGKPPDKR
jgi:hypothetical protein